MKNLFLFLFLVLIASKFLVAQDSIAWNKEFSYETGRDIVWTTDAYNNIYIADKDLIVKIDSKGKKLFEQSVKKYGGITKIDARNPMKILIFSEQQQSVFYLDNTLTKQENDIDLGQNFDLSYVTHVSASNQVDKIWTFDQDNSTINLWSQNKSQTIQIQNVAGLTGMKNIFQFFEQNDKLFVADSLKGVFIFDIYGTLIQSLEYPNLDWIDVSSEYLYVMRNGSFEIVNLSTLNKQVLTLPVSNIQKFSVNQNKVYFMSENQLIKYSIEIF